MRKKIIAGNWKMYKTPGQARELARAIRNGITKITLDREIVLCPPFPALYAVKEEIEGSNIGLGAQNIYPKEEGAFTGEVSPLMLQELGVSYVIIGHSERRQYFKEEDGFINQKVLIALKYGLKPILCVGETLKEREEGRTEHVIESQLRAVAEHGHHAFSNCVIAYEPVWAMGTGLPATPEQVQSVHAMIRAVIAQSSENDAKTVSLLYGGSVNEKNAEALFAMPDVDGGLIGGAALNIEDFKAIIDAI